MAQKTLKPLCRNGLSMGQKSQMGQKFVPKFIRENNTARKIRHFWAKKWSNGPKKWSVKNFCPIKCPINLHIFKHPEKLQKSSKILRFSQENPRREKRKNSTKNEANYIQNILCIFTYKIPHSNPNLAIMNNAKLIIITNEKT